MKVPGKSVLDDHDDNFAIVFAAMGVSINIICHDHCVFVNSGKMNGLKIVNCSFHFFKSINLIKHVSK